MWKSWTSFVVLLAVAPTVHAVDRVVGITATMGNASLVKRVHVEARSEIIGVEIVSNDLAIVFPAVRIRRLDRCTAGEILSEVRNVAPNNGSRHRFTVSIPPVVFQDDEDILIEVVLPPSPGIQEIGSGAGLGAYELAGRAATSYIGNTATGDLQTIDADLCLSLLGPAPAKPGADSPASVKPGSNSDTFSLQVRRMPGGDLEIEVTTASSVLAAVEIYDVRGSRVRALAHREPAASRHTLTWDGHNDVGRPVAAGVYFIVARGQDLEVVRKAVVLR